MFYSALHPPPKKKGTAVISTKVNVVHEDGVCSSVISFTVLYTQKKKNSTVISEPLMYKEIWDRCLQRKWELQTTLKNL